MVGLEKKLYFFMISEISIRLGQVKTNQILIIGHQNLYQLQTLRYILLKL